MKTYQFTLELTEEQIAELMQDYETINHNGGYDNFDEFIEEAINFRLLRHIRNNIEVALDIVKHNFPNPQQT